MELAIKSFNDILIVEVSGEVDSRAAGPLYDTLVRSVEFGWRKLVVDLSRVERVTRVSVRAFIVASRMLKSTRGELRLCTADPAVAGFLSDLGFNYLLTCDDALEASIAALSAGSNGMFALPAPSARTAPRRAA